MEDYEGLHKILVTKDFEKGILTHSIEIVHNVEEILEKVELSSGQRKALMQAAWLHDLGKYGIIRMQIFGSDDAYGTDYDGNLLHGAVAATYLRVNCKKDIEEIVPDLVIAHTSIPITEKDVEEIGRVYALEDEQKIVLPSPYSENIEFSLEGVNYRSKGLEGEQRKAGLILMVADNYSPKRVKDVISRKPFLKREAGNCIKRNVFRAARELGIESRFSEFDEI